MRQPQDDEHSNDIDRRTFLKGVAAISAVLLVGAAALTVPPAAQQTASALPPLDLAEWTNGYIGVETVALPRGELMTGKNIYVEVSRLAWSLTPTR